MVKTAYSYHLSAFLLSGRILGGVMFPILYGGHLSDAYKSLLEISIFLFGENFEVYLLHTILLIM